MRPIRIIVADDHGLMRRGLSSLLAELPGFEVVGEACDGHEALGLIETLTPDIAFMDVMMPNMNGLEAAKIVHDRDLLTKIIIVSMHSNPTYAIRALQNGAQAYLLKDAPFSEVVQAVEDVINGKRYLCSNLVEEVFEILLKAEESKVETLDALSPREREVLQFVAEGNTNLAIAARLSLSVRTVESHRLSLMKKLRLGSHTDLVRFAVNQGLIRL